MRVVGGASDVCTFGPAEVVAIVLGEPSTQPPGVLWDIYVDVKIEEGGFTRLGAIRTGPVAARLAPQRVVASAICPGAKAWRVTIATANPNARAEIFIAGDPASKVTDPEAGVFPINPAGGPPVDAVVIPW